MIRADVPFSNEQANALSFKNMGEKSTNDPSTPTPASASPNP